MKPRTPAPLFLILLAPLACGPAVDTAAEEDALRAITAHWQQLDEARDADGVAALFAGDARVYWSERPPAVGTAAIRDHMATAYAENPSGAGSWAAEGYRVAGSGDLAVEEGSWEGPAGEGRYITVYEKSAGSWTIATDLSIDMTPDGGAPEWAVDWLEGWYVAFNGRDAQGLAAMYAPDAMVGDARGRRAIAASFQADWAEANLQCSGAYDGFRVSGDFATGWGRDVCRAESGEVVQRSTWLAVYDRQPDGSWICIRDNGEVVE